MNSILRDCLATTIAAVLWLLACVPALAATPSVSAGPYHALALRADGNVRAWGNATSGELADGRELMRVAPASVVGIANVTAVSSGLNFALARTSDGNVWSWGDNRSGQLGDGTTTDRSIPNRIIELSNVVSIAAGNVRSYAIRNDGSLWGWGANPIGDGTAKLKPAPVALTNVVSVATGLSHTLAARSDGTVWAWGSNDAGQLGLAVSTTYINTPTQVAGLSNVIAVSAGARHSLALRSDGSVLAWGANANGQLGSGTFVDRATPGQVQGLSGVASISAGGAHNLARRNDGAVMAWGSGSSGQLGDGSSVDRSLPVVVNGLGSVASISAGGLHSLAALTNGTVMAWGSGFLGQLGNAAGGTIVPTRSGTIADAVAVSAGEYHSIAVRSGGSALSWGSNAAGVLGDAVPPARLTPQVVSGVNGVIAVAGGGQHGLALKSDGRVSGWGYALFGQVGSVLSVSTSTPEDISSLSNITAIAAGYFHSLALRNDGTVWALGYNASGQLGNNATASSSVAIQVMNLTNVVAIAAGDDQSFAIRNDGTLWAWGSNFYGQLGDGTTQNRLVPVRISTFTDVVSVSAGPTHTLIARRDGSVWTWGLNAFGQLGRLGADQVSPIVVVGVSGVASVLARGGSSFALTSEGAVWAWGRNETGELADGSVVSRARPAPIIALKEVAAIGGGGNSSRSAYGWGASVYALKLDGTLFAWGDNRFGQLGDGTLAQRPRPVAVLRENGLGNVQTNDWFLDLAPLIPKAIADDAIPRFLVASSAAGPDLVSNVKFNADDVGKTASVYVFALAPANLVKGAALKGGAAFDDPAYHINLKTIPSTAAAAKDGPLGCVLAQLNSAGQLTAVSASNLQAYVTGVLSAGGTAVNVLNNISAAAIQGSTFYVGYGASGTSMINNGVNRSVVTVRGTQTCQPQAPQTGWWWDPTQRDRGYGIEVRGNNLFYASFVNNPSGVPSWTVASGPTALDGSLFQASLYSYANGQTLTGSVRAPQGPTSEGLITISTATATQGTMIAPAGTRSLQRMEFVPSGLSTTPQTNQPENGWWWSTSEPGRGYFIEWQNGYASVTGYMYDEAGKPIWYQSMTPANDPRALSGVWSIFGSGYPLTQSGSSINRKMARLTDNFQALSIRFSDASNGTLTLPGGRNIAITRLRF